MNIALTAYNNTLEEQLYLQDNGVSFSYTDTLDAQMRKDLVNSMMQWREEHPRLTLF